MGRPQIIQLIALRTAAQKAWSGFVTHLSVSEKFEDIFGQVCHSLDNPEVYTYDGFKDELIGLLLKTLPNPDITYDRWLIELDPSEQKRRKLFGEPVQVLPSILNKDPVAPILSFPQEGVKTRFHHRRSTLSLPVNKKPRKAVGFIWPAKIF